jgi:CheY-like chemotaxis protein
MHDALVEIRKAAERSADLTRQMLAFARKQAVVPKVLDLNETVEGMLAMLRRLMGEEIDVTWLPQAGLWPVKVDPGQIDQILVNLCANARDAIAGDGKVTIRTGKASLDEAWCARHRGSVPGEYVLLAIGDDGSGMDKETLERLFEPFFTTKQVGRGTGLGLATVYGIVKQNDGFVEVDSEPGKGTTFRIYLPRHAGEVPKAGPERPAELPRGDGETILLVEDERAILSLGKSMLETLGYTVLASGTPAEAISTVEAHPGGIDLLMTDIVMPGMNGKELADRLRAVKPAMKCLFMSGYTADVIASAFRTPRPTRNRSDEGSGAEAAVLVGPRMTACPLGARAIVPSTFRGPALPYGTFAVNVPARSWSGWSWSSACEAPPFPPSCGSA